MKKYISTFVVCALLSGCATAYTGPRPDLTKTGADAQAEYKKFEISELYGGATHYAVTMGQKSYFTETVDPIAKDISPAWETRLNKIKVANYVSWGILAVTLATIFTPASSWTRETGYWIGLGALIGTGTGVYISVTGMHAAEEYNRDLKSKFTPALSLSKSF